MLLIDITLRFGCLTLLLFLAVLAFRDARHLLQGRLAVALCVSLAAMFASTMPQEFGLPFSVRMTAWILHVPNLELVWLFGLSLFNDSFRLRPIHYAVLVAVFFLMISIQLLSVWGIRTGVIPLLSAKRVVDFSVLAHLLWTAWSGRKDDLIEDRRRIRYRYTAWIALSSIMIITAESLHFAMTGSDADPIWLAISRSAAIFPLVVFGGLLFLRLPPQSLLFESAAPTREALHPSIDPKDQVTHSRLISVMEDDRLYREQGLSIGSLADRLSVPEHQLRALINKGLGYRNFSEFLNHYRLSDAKADLSNPEKARVPILTIAMDAGYASLATFNRAFKGAEGKTPSEFRASALSMTATHS